MLASRNLHFNGNVDKELSDDKGYSLSRKHVWSGLSRVIGKSAVNLGRLDISEEAGFNKEQTLQTAGFEAATS